VNKAGILREEHSQKRNCCLRWVVPGKMVGGQGKMAEGEEEKELIYGRTTI
jgi:hypothetical protein